MINALIIAMMTVPIYIVYLGILGKEKIRSGKPTKYIVIIPSLLTSIAIYVGAIVFWFFLTSYYPKIEFDKINWRLNPESRYEMSTDIINSNILLGRSRKEIVELLGVNFVDNSECYLAYYLGSIPLPLNMEPDYLGIYFENGSVTKVVQLHAQFKDSSLVSTCP